MLRWEPGIRNFTSVFDDRTSFRAEGLRGTPGNRNFTSVFNDRNSFRAKGLRRTTCKSQVYHKFNLIFGDRTLFRARGLRRTTCKSHFYNSFWRSNLISCERVAPDDLQIAILLQFLAIKPHFVRKGCVSCRLVGTAPRLQERNRKEGEGKRARAQEGKRAKGQEGKRARG